jgi:muramidase (phage lysozyme)
LTTLNIEPRLEAFLNLIAQSEGTSNSPITTANGYDIIVTGVDGPHRFDDYSCHPFTMGREPIIVREARPARAAVYDPDSNNQPLPAQPAVEEIRSTASGRYQIILPTWKHLANTYKLGTFSPQSQDLAALHLLDECHATPLIINGDIEDAIVRACDTWASFPGNLYNQGMHTMEALLTAYHNFLSLTGTQGA